MTGEGRRLAVADKGDPLMKRHSSALGWSDATRALLQSHEVWQQGRHQKGYVRGPSQPPVAADTPAPIAFVLAVAECGAPALLSHPSRGCCPTASLDDPTLPYPALHVQTVLCCATPGGGPLRRPIVFDHVGGAKAAFSPPLPAMLLTCTAETLRCPYG
jgi:hypothetical protein